MASTNWGIEAVIKLDWRSRSSSWSCILSTKACIVDISLRTASSSCLRIIIVSMQIIITLDTTTPITAMEMIFPEIENLIDVSIMLFLK
jgi:hypothetical protein